MTKLDMAKEATRYLVAASNLLEELACPLSHEHVEKAMNSMRNELSGSSKDASRERAFPSELGNQRQVEAKILS